MLASAAQLAAIVLVLAPSLASAAIFPKDTLVKMIDPKGFRQVMKTNHCQRMAPEYSKAATGLHPLIPVYAVDCDAEPNKRLCAEQLFPRGNQLGSMTYESGERTASAFFYWASRRVPNPPAKLSEIKDILPWVEKTSNKHRALLLTKDKKVPLLWKVLSNKYKSQLELGTHRDREGRSSEALGLEAEGKTKVLIYPAGSTKFMRYEGLTKLDSLSTFFDSVLDGTADLSALNEPAEAEESVSDEEEPDPEPEFEKKTEVEAEAEVPETPAPEASQVVVDDDSEHVTLEHAKEEAQKSAPEASRIVVDDDSEQVLEHAKEKVQKPAPEASQVVVDDDSEQVIFEHAKEKVQKSAPAESQFVVDDDSEQVIFEHAKEKVQKPAPEVTQVVVDDDSEQVILEHAKEEVQKPASTGGQCAPAENGPGAEVPVECDPPVATPASERPADEL
ncbi:hypothetical protein C0995_014697 [Termitomyces sp. Mi166|nr:hypothetical protein C0995_014697 [Termitomyces sp. Mi166\